MKETERIADQLRRAFYGEAWHGPSVQESLSGVTAEMASQRPLANAHTIWELVHHITAWADIARRRVEGEKVNVTTELDWPPVSDTTEAGWKESLKRLEHVESDLRKTTLQIPESRLEEPAMEGGSLVYILLHGVVQHALYHAGQIVLLKKF
jgi:uncharacterized damage-inducible protein DinB